MCTSCNCSTAGTQTIDLTTPDAPQTWSEEFILTGVTCGGCAGKVTEAVAKVDGIDRAEVDVASSTLTVHATSAVPRDAIAAAVGAAGYGLS
ncbi:heavy-metal-associated domain-containing protein [Nocardioides massiliensis]|uniref:Copper chaperone CopZ n=1 Tax=Nocardioides massiliensis TaxID=1325935 RepID=A0ABT9NW75_9ACTN|nr:heavy-metal-associated domain-containing protein [Nocardioides massiliensis]MDP9824075.1 copper chaperone CopZ [Nocardioides massiliensis]